MHFAPQNAYLLLRSNNIVFEEEQPKGEALWLFRRTIIYEEALKGPTHYKSSGGANLLAPTHYDQAEANLLADALQIKEEDQLCWSDALQSDFASFKGECL